MSEKVTKATIERFMEANGASETQIQVATCRYEQCKTDKERNELFTELRTKRGGAKKADQNKAVSTGDTKAPVAPAAPAAPTAPAAPATKAVRTPKPQDGDGE